MKRSKGSNSAEVYKLLLFELRYCFSVKCKKTKRLLGLFGWYQMYRFILREVHLAGISSNLMHDYFVDLIAFHREVYENTLPQDKAE